MIPPYQSEFLDRLSPVAQLTALHRITTLLADRSTSSAAEMDVTSELHTVFKSRWVALYRSESDGTLLRRVLVGAGNETPPERIDGNSEVLRNTFTVPAAISAFYGPQDIFGLGALIAPLNHHGEQMGVVVVGPPRAAEIFTLQDAEFLQFIARVATPHLFYLDARYGDKSVALSDPVTGLGNRRAFEERIGEELARSNRSGQQVALLVLSIDTPNGASSPVNDTLHAVVDALRQSIRLSDPAFRTGARQFSALLVRSDTEGAMIVAKRVMAAAAGIEDREKIPLTLSIGVAALKAGVKHTPLDLAALALTRKAEDALRLAMEAGGKRVVAG